MAISAVQLVSIPVSDQDRAKEFYVDVLGLELMRDAQMQPGMRWVQVRPRGAATSITLVTWFDSMPAGSLRGLILEADDIDAEAERLAGLGVKIPEGVEQAPWGRYIALSDPDGNGIIIQHTTARD